MGGSVSFPRNKYSDLGDSVDMGGLDDRQKSEVMKKNSRDMYTILKR
jgi:hypothetical protein